MHLCDVKSVLVVSINLRKRFGFFGGTKQQRFKGTKKETFEPLPLCIFEPKNRSNEKKYYFFIAPIFHFGI